MNRITHVLISALCCADIGAQEASVLQQDLEAPQEAAVSTSSTPFFKPGNWSINLYGGSYEVTDEPQFVGIRNEYSLGLGFSADFNRYSYSGTRFRDILC